SGIRVREIAPDWTSGELSMRVAPWTANTNGTAFGGSLFAATDVLYGGLLSGQLGGKYQVWTKTAAIDFQRPGRGRLHCSVEVPPSPSYVVREALVTRSTSSVVPTAQIIAGVSDAVCRDDHTNLIRRCRSPLAACRLPPAVTCGRVPCCELAP